MENIYRLACLEKDEISILKLLAKEAMLANEISKLLDIPRATLDRKMAHLLDRGFVSRLKKGKRHWYKATSQDSLLSKYGLINKQQCSGVQIYQGKVAMLELTKKFVELQSKKRVKVLQTKQTWDFWTKYLTSEQNYEVNTLLRREEVINEGIFSEALLNDDNKGFFATYLKRPSMVHILPEKYAQFVTDITVTDDELYIMNWQDEVGIKIVNKDTVSAFNQIFAFINDNTDSTSIYKLTSQ